MSGRNVRLHVKRFPRMRGKSPAELEAEGYRLLKERGIPSAEVAAWGTVEDGRSFIATEDLAGFSPADKLMEAGLPFDRVLGSDGRSGGTAPWRRAASSRSLPLPFHGAIYAKRRGGDTPDRRGPCSTVCRGADATAMDRQGPGTVLVQHAGDECFGFATGPVAAAILREGQDGGVGIAQEIDRAQVSGYCGHDEKLRRREPLRNISIPKS